MLKIYSPSNHSVLQLLLIQRLILGHEAWIRSFKSLTAVSRPLWTAPDCPYRPSANVLSVSGLIVFDLFFLFWFVFLVCQKIPPLLSELKVCLIAPTLQRLHSLNRGPDIHNKRDFFDGGGRDGRRPRQVLDAGWGRWGGIWDPWGGQRRWALSDQT